MKLGGLLTEPDAVLLIKKRESAFQCRKEGTMSSINREGIVSILQGAAFLGAGGGGALDLGLKMLKQLEDDGYEISLNLIEPEEMAAGTLAATVAGLGAPSNVDMQKFEKDLPGAFAALCEGYRVEDKRLSYLYSGEMGGLNTMVPIMLHIVSDANPQNRINVVNADANGRAVPELNTCLVTARGFPPAPVGIQGHDKEKKETECRYTAWTKKKEDDTAEDVAKTAEGIARSLAIQYGQVGFATWALSEAQLKENACPGYLSLALKIGRTLDIGSAYTEGKMSDICGLMGGRAKCLCIGKVSAFCRDVSAGFDVGKTTILTDDRKTCEIDFQNENIVAYYDGDAVITAPERICIIDYDTCTPLTNVDEDIYIGRRVAVILSAAHANWWKKDVNPYRCWNSILDRVNYVGEYIDFDGMRFPRK